MGCGYEVHFVIGKMGRLELKDWFAPYLPDGFYKYDGELAEGCFIASYNPTRTLNVMFVYITL